MKAAVALALAVTAAVWMRGEATLSAARNLTYRVVELQKGHLESPVVAVPVPQVSLDVEVEVEVGAGAARGGVQGRIVEGEEAEPCQFPHQIAMRTQSLGFCGGSLLSQRWVLTAAHCIETATSVTVFVGSTEWRTAPHQIPVSRIFIHGAYNAYFNNDIALLELTRDVPLSDCVRPVELETSGCGDSSLDGIVARVSGWGHTYTNQPNVEDKLRWVRTRPISNAECAAAFNEDIVVERTICSEAYGADASGTLCNGDSGGALITEATGRQIGINSFVSIQGCEAAYPSGYARVPCFVDWIHYVMTL